jgi:hypothetical protein
MKAFPSRAPINADCIGITEHAGMDLLDYHAARALPLAYEFYKNAIEGDNCIFQWEGEVNNTPSIDLGIVSQYAYLLGKAMLKAKNELG